MEEQTQVALINTRTLPELKQSRDTLREYVSSQMHEGTDFGTIPGTKKPTLYKAGAEKLAKLFRLGARIVGKDKIMDLENNWVWFSYTVELYHLDSGKVVSQCEGSSNNLETKNKNKPLPDLLNTLQKMAQKRAFVGAVLLGVGASDFYTQDMEDVPVVNVRGPNLLRPVVKAEPASAPLELPIGNALTYVVPFGKFKGRQLREIPFDELDSYCNYILAEGEKKGMGRDSMSASVQEFLHESEQYLFGSNTQPGHESNVRHTI